MAIDPANGRNGMKYLALDYDEGKITRRSGIAKMAGGSVIERRSAN